MQNITEQLELVNLDIEQSVLGCLLSENNIRWLPKLPELNAECFSEQTHQELFAACQDLAEQGIKSTPVLVLNHIGESPELKTYVMAAMAKGETYLDLEPLVDVLVKLAQRRKLVEAANDLLDMATQDRATEPMAMVTKTQDKLESIITNSSTGFRTEREVTEAILQNMEMGNDYDPTHIPVLDHALLGGLYQSRSYCMAARPKNCKTTMLGTVSYNLNMQGIKHLFIAAEMGAEQIHQRYVARSMNRNPIAFFEDAKKPEFKEAVARQAEKARNNILYYDFAGGTFDQLKRIVLQAIVQKKVKGFMLDYLQLVGGKPRNMNDAEFQLEVAQWIANTCRRHKVWCLYAAQINRDGNIRGSDGIIMAADMVYQIHKTQQEGDSQEYAWLEHKAARYAKQMNIGSEERPAFYVSKNGVFIADMNDKPSIYAGGVK